jgi:hypothetical protein
MQRSSRPSLRSHARRAAVVGTSVLAAGLLVASPAAATGGSGHGGHGGSHRGDTWTKPKPKPSSTTPTTPTPMQSAQPKPTRGGQTTTAAYVYLKKDAKAPASWENSTQQYLVATWDGAQWRNITWDQIKDAVPFEVCGPGWGVQEDAAYGGPQVFTDSDAPHYPDGVLKWVNQGGPLFAADHWDLEEQVGAVPACAPTYPVPTQSATPTPTVTPTPSATPSVTPEAPTPTPVPTDVVDDDVTPTPSATPTPVATPVVTPSPTSEVLAAAPSSTPTPTVRSEVLAAGALATTGSTALPLAVGAGVLVAAGGVLLALRHRRRPSGSDA